MKLRHLLPALLLGALPLATIATPSTAQAQIEFSVNFAPPALPVYVQPACPVEGYLWTPGYWSYAEDDYYWVPGVWVAPPRPGFLWTPGYWGFEGGIYGFHRGYWGQTVGFYGGVNYGWGYGGHGFYGGRWEGNNFRYNTAVVNVNKTVIHNTYIDKTVINKTVNRNGGGASFNGPNGVQAKPRPEELAAEKAEHVPPTAEQTSHREEASKNKEAFAKANHGKPAVTAQPKVGGGAPNAEEPKPAEQAANKPGQPEAANGETPQEQKAARKNANHQTAEAQHNEGQTPQEQKAARKNANRQAAEGQNAQEQKAQRKNANREAAENRPSAPAGNPGRPGPVANEEKHQHPQPQPQHQAQPKPQPKAQPKAQPGNGGEKKEGHDKKPEGGGGQ